MNYYIITGKETTSSTALMSGRSRARFARRIALLLLNRGDFDFGLVVFHGETVIGFNIFPPLKLIPCC